MSLWPHQQLAVGAVIEAWTEEAKAGATEPARHIICLPTGCGKTRTALELIDKCAAAGKRVCLLVPTIVLCDQPVAAIAEHTPHLSPLVGVVQATRSADDAQIVVGSVQTLAIESRLERMLEAGPIGLLVVDECHHAPSPMWDRVITGIEEHARAAGVGQRTVGLTATPYRGDGAPLGADWRIAYAYWVRHAIERDGILVRPIFVRSTIAGIGDVRKGRGGDYIEKDLVAALTAADVAGHTVRAIQEHAEGRSRIVVFTVTVEQAQETSAALNAAGIVAEWVSGETPQDERDTILAGLESAAVRVVCNAAVLTEGWDCPAVDCIVDAQPTLSLTRAVQKAGRGLRRAEGKADCLIIDMAAHWMIPDRPELGGIHDIYTAGHLLYAGERPESKSKKKGAPQAIEELDTTYEGLRRRRDEQIETYTWCRVERLDRGAWAMSVGAQGTAYAVETEPGSERWRTYVHVQDADVSRRVMAPVVHEALDEAHALEVLTGWSRVAGMAEAALRRGSYMRDKQKPTQRQAGWLGRQRQPIPETRGEAADAMTARIGRWTLVRAGLAEEA